MTMASRIVVMKDGYIQQVGAPKDIYDNPANMFVGGFIGTPPMNFIHGKVEDGYFKGEGIKVKVPESKLAILKENKKLKEEVVLGVRPENIFDRPEKLEEMKDAVVKLKVDVAELLGAETNIHLQIGDRTLTAKVGARDDIHIGDEMELAFDMETVHFFDPESELRLK
jgi:multiple sugar transport system ATP-binding protein